MDTHRVIDSDGHVQERDTDIRPHYGRALLQPARVAVAKRRVGFQHVRQTRDASPRRGDRLRDMDKETIDTSVLFPTSAFHMSRLTEKDYAAAYCRAYNNWIAEHCKESPRLKGVGSRAVSKCPGRGRRKQIARSPNWDLAGIAIASFGMKEHLGKPEFWPIYEELQRLNVPLLVHNSRQGPAGEIRFDTFLFKHTIGRPFETLIDCAALMYGGVPEKFPKLRIAFLECGAGWVPYWMDRMDEEWEKRQSEAPLLKAKPSEYMTRGNWFFAAEPEESTLAYVLDHVGENVILFASDYPHWDGNFPYMVSTLRERKDISATAKQKILCENALRLYGWDR